MGRYLIVAAVLFTASACKKDKSEGLPPAQEWSANANTLPPAPQPGTGPVQQGGNPHAGMDMNNPHAGMDMNNPHAGMDTNNPHGGMAGGGTDVTKMGLPPPDPNRQIDPTHRVAGTIEVHPKAAARLADGGAVFVIVKAAGADGAPSGPPLAVDKLTWAKSGIKFEMTEAQSMIAGTQLAGTVVVTARYDQDGDALSKQPGDVVGTVRVTVPADNVKLLLDDVLN